MLTLREADLRDVRSACTTFNLSRVNVGRYSFILAGLLLVSLCLGAVANGKAGKTQMPLDRALAAARVAMLNRRFSEAVHLLKKALERFPEDNRLRVALGRAYLYQGKEGLAIKQFREALRREASDRLARLELARALADRGDYKASSQLYQELLAANPNDEAAAIGLTSNLMHKKQASEALRVASQALARHPDSLVLQEYKDRIKQGEFGGDERAPERQVNDLQSGVNYISDSMGDRSWEFTQGFDYEIAPRVLSRLQVEERNMTSTDSAPANVAAGTDELHFKLTNSAILNLGGGGVRFGDGTGRTLYNAGLDFHPAKRLWLGGGFSRTPFYPDAKAAGYNLTAEGWHALAAWRPRSWQVNAWWSGEHYSDGNLGRRGGAEVFRWFGSPRLSFETGYRFTHYDFRQDPGHGYFSPDEYQSHLGLTGVRFRLKKVFHAEYLARVGAESISRGGPFQTAWEISLRNWVSLGKWEVGGQYFHLHVVQNTGAFVSHGGQLYFRYRF